MSWSVDISGTDITPYCQEITWNPKLSRPASLIVRFPAHLASATTGVSELHLYNGGTLLFSGPVWYQENTGSEDAAYTQLTAYDHTIYFVKRLCKTGIDYTTVDRHDLEHFPGPCNLANPVAVFADFDTATEIMGEFIQATIDCDNDKGPGPGGVAPFALGSVATGGASVTGAPSDWPMDIATMANNLLSTGQLDIVVNPGIGTSTIDLYNGDYGNDLSGSVILQYATGSFTARTGNRTEDMEEMTNALWYLLGPKRPWYAGDVAHWAGSITPTAPNAGPDGDGGIPGPSWPVELSSRWTSGRAQYGYMQEIQINDTKEDEQTTSRPYFEEMYANEAYIRAVTRVFSNLNPNRFSTAPTFYVGDFVGIQSGAAMGAVVSGKERVYEYELTIDTDGVAEFTSLVTSPSQD